MKAETVKTKRINANIKNGFHQSFHNFSSFFGSKNSRYSLAAALFFLKKKGNLPYFSVLCHFK